MKRYAIPIMSVLAVLVIVMVTFGQADNQGEQRQSMRQRFRNMSQEERAQLLERLRLMGLMPPSLSREEQEKAVKVIEQQLVKFKAAIQVEQPQVRIRDLPEEDRNKIRESFTTRRTALQTIVEQVALLQGHRPPGQEDVRFIIINTAELKPIMEMAEKEKAKETSELLKIMAARGSWVRGGFEALLRGKEPGENSQR